MVASLYLAVRSAFLYELNFVNGYRELVPLIRRKPGVTVTALPRL